MGIGTHNLRIVLLSTVVSKSWDWGLKLGNTVETKFSSSFAWTQDNNVTAPRPDAVTVFKLQLYISLYPKPQCTGKEGWVEVILIKRQPPHWHFSRQGPASPGPFVHDVLTIYSKWTETSDLLLSEHIIILQYNHLAL